MGLENPLRLNKHYIQEPMWFIKCLHKLWQYLALAARWQCLFVFIFVCLEKDRRSSSSMCLHNAHSGDIWALFKVAGLDIVKLKPELLLKPALDWSAQLISVSRNDFTKSRLGRTWEMCIHDRVQSHPSLPESVIDRLLFIYWLKPIHLTHRKMGSAKGKLKPSNIRYFYYY